VEQAGRLVAPARDSELAEQDLPLRRVEQVVVDLVGVLVLDKRPGEAAAVEQARVEPDLAGDGLTPGDPRAAT
jgi:hypothetical protein